MIGGEQIRLLVEQLYSLSSDTEEQIAIIKKATMSNWKSFYPLRKPKTKRVTFDQRSYDCKNLEKEILESQNKKFKKLLEGKEE